MWEAVATNRDQEIKYFKTLTLQLGLALLIILVAVFATSFLMRKSDSNDIYLYITLFYAVIYNIFFFKKQLAWHKLSQKMLHS
ncbi:hypothetical protein SU48_11805 [Deinococcus puniceus]|uniref:Uncharacterized protein n=1 Tax=Deinococcus puniceus TaxID=1182568 RepID=A0A172TBM5_9DEIO|nr:hypothetical protein SU48_11805 [Deinococcus puniceus]